MAMNERTISTRIDTVSSENADELAHKIMVLKDQKKAATMLILEAHYAMLKHVQKLYQLKKAEEMDMEKIWPSLFECLQTGYSWSTFKCYMSLFGLLRCIQE